MSSIEKSVPAISSLSKLAKVYDDLPLNKTQDGIKKAFYLYGKIQEAKEAMKNIQKNSEKDETITVTADDIRSDMYR